MRNARALRRHSLPFLFLLLPVILFGCSDSTGPNDGATDTEASVDYDGLWNATVGEFLLQRVEAPGPDGRPFAIELIGSGIAVDPVEEIVSVGVAVRNGTNRELYPPIIVRLHHFVPGTVVPLPGDLSVAEGDSNQFDQPERLVFIDYSDFLGSDGVLSPGETSQARRWRFHVPGLEAFAFGAEVSVGLEPQRPSLSGVVYLDADRDGTRDPNEPPGLGGWVEVRRPDGSIRMADVGPEGRWIVGVKEPGLHEARFLPPPTFAPVCYTTPNPLHVVLPPGPEGLARSFERADFGIDPEPCFPGAPTVQLTDRPPSDIASDPYQLIEIHLREDDRLVLRVGFSGCGPDHPFALFAGADFMESTPVRTWARLQHDGLGELCDAWFERDLVFDLNPIRRRHMEVYGTPGPIIVVFQDEQGQTREILLP